jgi:soluble lytic murein transglycosylase-like protein
MTTAPILRSAALQRALGQIQPPRAASVGATFANTLASARLPAQSRPKATAAKPNVAVQKAVAPLQAGEAVPFQNLITAAATKYGLDPALLAGVVKQESNFNPNAGSRAGAKGLCQLMDATARRLGVTDSFDPAQSLDGGAKFLSGLMKQFHGDQSLALAAYNAGPGAVQKYGGIPPYQETQRYIPKVLGYAARFSRLWTGSSATPATTS